jgi:beta-lactam-binding protein with PASTA domain
VLAQSPPPNASDVAAPKISLLVSDSNSPEAFVMPSFVGQTLSSATAALQDAGLHVGNVSTAPQTPSVPSESPTPVSPASSSPGAVIVSQDPIPGQKVISGSAVNFEVR